MNKLYLPLSLLAVFGLTACGSITLPGANSSQPTSNEVQDESEKLANPNRFFLNSIAKTISNPTRGTEINFSSDALIASSIKLPGYETENRFAFDIDGVLSINQDQGFTEALVNIAINQFVLSSNSSGEDFSFTNDLVYENETATIFVDETNIYVDLSTGATDIPQFLFPSANRTFPTQFQSPFDFDTEFGSITPNISESEVDVWVTATLPMVDSLKLLDKSLNGTDLTVTYEITQDDLYAILERMFLGTSTRENLTDEENLVLDGWLEQAVSAYTLNRFVLSLTLNTLSNTITDVLVDIDVVFNYAYSLNYQEYDPENPEADDNGYIVTGTYFLEWTYRYDVFFQASLTFFESPILLVAPINKEEYEVIELSFEDPNLV